MNDISESSDDNSEGDTLSYTKLPSSPRKSMYQYT